MDLDGFGDLPGSTLKVSLQSEDAVSAVKYIDSTWYGGLSRKARWMDLVGDFAGDEPFVIDGDSLLQHILDDEMLAIGGEDLSMQLLHAKYAVERFLAEFLRHTRNFDIVFWHAHRFTSLIAGGNPFAYSSRCLARQVLIHHLQVHVDNLEVHQFKSVVDLEWLGYLRRRRPMYVMLNDGGVLSSDPSSSVANGILLQRVAILELMTQGLSCTLLFGVEFRDSKILSFVLDQRLDRKFRSRLNPRFGKAVNAATNLLNRTDLAIRGQFSSAPFTGFKIEVRKAADKDSPMIGVVREVLSSTGENPALNHLLLYLFVAHVHLLPELAVGARARTYRQLHPDLESHLRSMFLPTIFFALECHYSGRELDIDGRIFVELLAFVSEHSPSKLSDVIGDALASTVDEIWQNCSSPCIDFQALSTQYPLPSHNVSPREPLDFDVSVMPFESALFQEAISSVQAVVLNEGEESEPQAEGLHIPFSDTRHWHNESTILPKHLGGEDRVALTNWQRERKLRSEQRFVAKMQWQAESLTGALGRPLQRITIVPHASNPTKTSKPSTSQVPKPPKKGKKEHISKADLIRQQHVAKKRIESDNSNETWWREQLATLSSLSVSAQTAQLDRLSDNRRSDEGWLAVEARLYRIHLLFLGWIERSSTQTEDLEQTGKARDEFAVRILRVAKETFENGNLFPSALAVLDTTLRAIGLSCFYDTLSASSPNPLTEDRKLSFKFVKLLRSKTKSPAHKYMPIVEHPIEWQLRLFGEYMDRSMDSTDDPRVPFKPDAWQREVLDCLDQEGHSVLVVAPTSAGKTFISYYAMEQVLRSSDNDILVYIAPTKALVSQIAAEVYARFQKTFTSSGKSMWAIHTRDYRVNNPQNCQILVTVPEMFAIMLLSPPLAKVWTPRIKRIILDEIHTIGQQEGGAVWEQIILLAPCPIIGLSATIGEPEKFNTWLRSVQEAHGFRHTFINWPYRYSHLRKFEYVLRDTADTTFGGLEKHVASDCMRFLHPVSLLSFGPRNLPPDFSLEAADCLSLFCAFSKAQDTLHIDIEALSPVVHLPSSSLLTQKDVLLYESILKDQLKTIIALSDAQDASSPLNQIVGFVQDPVLANVPAEVRARPAAAQAILSHLLGLIADLYKSGDLPAILFHFDRTGCEKAAKTLLDSLEEAETAWREASPEWARIMQQWQTWKSQAKAREAQAEKMRKNRSADEEDVLSTEDPTWQQSFDPNDPSAQFSFLSPKCPKALIEEAIDDVRWTSTPPWALRALRRGIGLHHSGMNKHYRTTVESLYRLGHLRVVIATGTLALGINAPTKTSVFCSDSPFLTALMYRQCAGRAGRRGYDLLGKVVFYGLPADRVQRLVLSKLPALGGNFPLTTTMVLRLFNLLHGSGHAPYAVEAVKSLLHLPQVGFTSEAGRSELMHHIRFSIDYLRRSSLLDRLGNPINLFGLTNHLYYTEPSNFALAALVQSRVIHRLCRRDGLEDAKRGVLHLLCHLFGRRNVPRAYTSAENAKDLLAKSASKVILTPLPKAAVRVLREKDDTTLKIFNGYAVAFARQSAAANQLAADVALPLSGVAYAGSSSTNAFIEHLRATSIQVTARPSFVANSGHDDAFRSIADLTQNARSGIHLKEHGIPSFHHLISENPHALNAYILDFYNHGQTDPLVIANGIRRGEIWYLLQDFMLTLKTFRASLAHMLVAATESDTQDPDVEVQAVDPAELDVMDAEAEGPMDSLIRPRGVSDDDWKVYEVVHALTEDFDAKFRKMWA